MGPGRPSLTWKCARALFNAEAGLSLLAVCIGSVAWVVVHVRIRGLSWNYNSQVVLGFHRSCTSVFVYMYRIGTYVAVAVAIGSIWLDIDCLGFGG